MQVVILAGGLGTRLSEETVNIPKPMVAIGEDPILLHLMRYYASYGHTNFVIALGYKGYVIKEFFSNYRLHKSDLRVRLTHDSVEMLKGPEEDWDVRLVDTGQDTATGGRLLKLRDHLDDEFMFTYGDGLSNVDLDALLSHHKRIGKIGTVTAVRPPARFGSIVIDGEAVERFSEKNPQDAGWINGGFFCFSKSICDYIPSSSTSLESTPLEKLVSERELSAYTHEGFWQPMDTLRDRHTLETLWQEGNAPWKR